MLADEIERIRVRTVHTRGGELSFLAIDPKDPDAFTRRFGRTRRALAELSSNLFRESVYSVPLQFVKGSVDEVAAAVRTYYDGPFEGYSPEFEHRFARRKLKSRGRRLLTWAGEWAIGIGIAIAIVFLLSRCD